MSVIAAAHDRSCSGERDEVKSMFYDSIRRQNAMTSDVPGIGREILLRDGWYAVENYAGETFRWARNNARLVIPAFESGTIALRFEVEIGPGVRVRPAMFMLYDLENVCVYNELINNRSTISILLRNNTPTVHAVRLSISNGGNPSGLDRRLLDFRLLWVTLELV